MMTYASLNKYYLIRIEFKRNCFLGYSIQKLYANEMHFNAYTQDSLGNNKFLRFGI